MHWKAFMLGIATIITFGALNAALSQNLTNAWWDGPASGPTLFLQYDSDPGQPSITLYGPDAYEANSDPLGEGTAFQIGPLSWSWMSGSWPLLPGPSYFSDGMALYDFTVDGSGVPGQIENFQGPAVVIPEATPLAYGLASLLMFLTSSTRASAGSSGFSSSSPACRGSQPSFESQANRKEVI